MCPFCQVGRPAGWVLPTTIKNYKRTANTTTLVCYICNIGQPTRRTNLKSSVVSSFHFSFSSNFFSFFHAVHLKKKSHGASSPQGQQPPYNVSIQCQHFWKKNTCLVGMTSRVNLRSIDICLILPGNYLKQILAGWWNHRRIWGWTQWFKANSTLSSVHSATDGRLPPATVPATATTPTSPASSA